MLSHGVQLEAQKAELGLRLRRELTYYEALLARAADGGGLTPGEDVRIK